MSISCERKVFSLSNSLKVVRHGDELLKDIIYHSQHLPFTTVPKQSVPAELRNTQ